MAVTSDSIKARWPVLAQVTDQGEFDAAMADAALQVSAAAWGTLYELGVTHLSAHALMLAHPGLSGPGPVQSESVGAVSRTYAVAAAPSGSGYGATAPGREYLRLRGMLGLGFTVV